MSESKLWSVYLIRNERGALYAGIAADVARRFREQQTGGARAAKFLRGSRSLELVYSCAVGNRSLASRAESRIKKLQRAEKLQLVTDAPERDALLARLDLDGDELHE